MARDEKRNGSKVSCWDNPTTEDMNRLIAMHTRLPKGNVAMMWVEARPGAWLIGANSETLEKIVDMSTELGSLIGAPDRFFPADSEFEVFDLLSAYATADMDKLARCLSRASAKLNRK